MVRIQGDAPSRRKTQCIIIGGETKNVSPFSLPTADLYDRLLCKLLLLGYTDPLIGVTIYQGADRSGHHGRYLIGPRNFHQVNMASP
ncbi:hypothetical protein [Kushneria phyllosphaerae]|uniref:hypothetical protein n=1 Tax=Kushneria phyllosphaerae TaxID=2100822 RepID=UPI00105820DF|nr:hypothetical protein [Kushneria phyllosphaerae]